MSDIVYPRKDAIIQGVRARIVIPVLTGRDDSYKAVENEDQVREERLNPSDFHHCGLCERTFVWEDFEAHAPGCIVANTARWERQRDREPVYYGPSKNGGRKRYNTRLIVPGHSFEESPDG